MYVCYVYRECLRGCGAGGHEKSISLFKRYLDLCQQNNDKVGEGQARAALANAFENLDDAESAIMELEGLLEVSQSTGEIRSQVYIHTTIDTEYAYKH